MPAERVTASHPTGPLPDNPMRVGFGAFDPDPADPAVVRTARPRYTYLTEACRFGPSTRNVL